MFERTGWSPKPTGRVRVPQDLPLFWECSVDSLHDSLKTRRCWCDSSRSHHSRKRRVRRRSHKPTLPVQLGILLPTFSERSLEVRYSAWDRDHACAGAQQRDRAAAGGAHRAESDEHESIPPLFVALPAARAPALLTPRAARGYAISALRATSDHFFYQVCGSVSGAPAREAGEAGANPAHLTNVTEDKLAESPACRAGDSGGSTRRSRHFSRCRLAAMAAGLHPATRGCESLHLDHCRVAQQ
jgi:hypothetical protein